MNARFEGKVAIVTGAGSGIGLATARRLGAEGARVAVADIDADRARAAADQVLRAGAALASAMRCDVAREDEVVATVARVQEELGPVEVIVNNAGVMRCKAIERLTSADWKEVLDVDLLGAFFFIREGFRRMPPGSAIVNVSSIHAVETTPGVAPYAAAKTALLSLTRSASLEGKPKHIRVNAVLPGAIDTPMLWQNPNVKSGLEKIQRADVGTPDDVARAIAFLASGEAEFITGAAIRVDGGRLSEL